MIFDVEPSQIESLDGKKLVELMRKLLHAEAQLAGICLRGISVPLQINVPDGGEDARASWKGGLKETDYFPARFNIFQAKAGKLDPADWKKEVWTKGSQKKDAKRILNAAAKTALDMRGSYVGFTSAVLVGKKYDNRIKGIKDGISEAGGDPSKLKAIDIYDANKIAAWVSQHPAVSVWLNERQSGLGFAGFQTIEKWGHKAEISSIARVDDVTGRFAVISKNSSGHLEDDPSGQNKLHFNKCKERIVDHLAGFKNFVRLLGASGVGKTRLVYEIFKEEDSLAKISLSTSTIYCDYRDVGRQIFQISQNISDSGKSSLIIVDECPREVADKLGDIITAEGSKLRVLTVGNDNRPIIKSQDAGLNISVLPADESLINGIILQRFPKAKESDVSFIQKLSGGYPRIAVLATDNYSKNAHILKSIEDVVERIFMGFCITSPDHIRAIECLSLFNRLGADEEVSGQIDFVAEELARQTGDEMYEYLAGASQASQYQIVNRRGRFFSAQPLPIAIFLGLRRLDLLRVKSVLRFIETAPQELVKDFLRQWRHFDTSETVVNVSKNLLAFDGRLGTLEALNNDFNSECIDALVHVNPDGVAETINRVFGVLSLEELVGIENCRRNLVWALEKLVFRSETFVIAARLLLKLAAAETESWSSNATGVFKQLFHLRLSGTEAGPNDRFAVLDEGINYRDERIIAICVEALENTLERGHFSRSGGSEEIGSLPPLKDWQAKKWNEVFDFHRSGLERLVKIRSEFPKFSKRCEDIISSAIRSFICENLLDDIKKVVELIAKEKGIWLEAIKGVSSWLYYDRKGAQEEFSDQIREFYDSLLPSDPVQKALLYTKFWTADIHDPDVDYNSGDDSTMDFEYSSRMAIASAQEIAVEKELTDRAILSMAAEELNGVFPFAHELALRVVDPLGTFKKALQVIESYEDDKNFQFIRGMLTGIDERDPKIAKKCIKLALKSNVLQGQIVNIYTAVMISVERLKELILNLKEGQIEAADCVVLSYGRGLDHLNAADIIPFVDELALNHETDGFWAALEIIFMYQHGRSELNKQVAEWLKQQILSPKILEKAERRRGTGRGYRFEQIVRLVYRHYGVDDKFATALSTQITKLCQVDNYSVFSALDDSVQKIILFLVEKKPAPLWDVLSRFFEIATPREVDRLKRFTGAPLHGSGSNRHNIEGVLFGIPEKRCIEWAKIEPVGRAPFLCHFYPLFTLNEKGNTTWHPSLIKLTDNFGSVEKFRYALARRFRPSSWSGSLVPYLKVYLKPLKEWYKHPNNDMAFWARETYRGLEKQIERERQSEKEEGRM